MRGWGGLEIAGGKNGAGDYPMDFYAVSSPRSTVDLDVTDLRRTPRWETGRLDIGQSKLRDA